jgi:hypothetical protein
MPRVDPRFLRLGLRATLLCALLLAPWPGVGTLFTTAFSRVANVVVRDMRWHPPSAFGFASERSIAISFQPASIASPGTLSDATWYVVLAIRDVDSGAVTRSAIHLRFLVYVPLSVFVALTVAAPARWSRAWVGSVALGAGLLAVFACASVALPVVELLAGERVRALELRETTASLLDALKLTLIEMGSANAVLLWAIARWFVNRKGSWLWLTEAPATLPCPVAREREGLV